MLCVVDVEYLVLGGDDGDVGGVTSVPVVVNVVVGANAVAEVIVVAVVVVDNPPTLLASSVTGLVVQIPISQTLQARAAGADLTGAELI